LRLNQTFVHRQESLEKCLLSICIQYDIVYNYFRDLTNVSALTICLSQNYIKATLDSEQVAQVAVAIGFPEFQAKIEIEKAIVWPKQLLDAFDFQLYA